MDNEKVLQELGLSSGESKVYLALLKLGSLNVAKIKEETKLHRTTVYDFLEKLINKGLVSYVVKDNVKYFEAAPPERLQTFLKEKKELLNNSMSQLEKLQRFEKTELKVEVYRGKEGFKTLLGDLLKSGMKELLGFGIDEYKLKEKFPTLMEGYFKKEHELGIKERMIVEEGTSFLFEAPNITYRFIPKEFFSPIFIIIYGNKIGFLIMEPFHVVVIENKNLADGYKKWFNFVWKSAKSKGKKVK